MAGRFLKDLLKILITLGFGCAFMFIGAPLALVGYFCLYGLFPGATYVESLVIGLLALGAAGFIGWASIVWLTWCSGRLRNFSLRGLFLGMTLAALYTSLVTIVISWS